MKTIAKEVVTTVTLNVATLKDFTDFLEKKGMLYSYIHNCETVEIVDVFNHLRKTPFIACPEPLKDWCKFLKEYKHLWYPDLPKENWYLFLIEASFDWSRTGEGSTTWNNISLDWLNWCSSNKIQDFEI